MTATGGVPQLPLVVGGSGTLGRIMLQELVKKGCKTIRVMDMREPSTETSEAGAKIEFFKHKLGSDPASAMQEALKGVDCVFSLLTPNLMTATKKDFENGNIEGVKLLLAGARAANVSRFVHASSIAVTNHLVVSKDMTEDDPLPAIDDYVSWYDRTKRLGEEAVIKENRDGMSTVVIRGGGLMNDHNDYNFKDTFQTYPGYIITPACCAPIDQIDGHDFSRALILGAEKLDQPNVAGEAFFVTKGCSMGKEDIDRILAKELGWKIMTIPKVVQYIMMFVFWLIYMVKSMCGLPVPGCPMHIFLQMPGISKTYNNRKAQEVLGFKPEVTMEQTIKRIADQWRNSPAGISYTQKTTKKTA